MTTSESGTLTYIAFDLDSPRQRAAVLAAAEEIGLRVLFRSAGRFTVDIPSAESAYRLGLATTRLMRGRRRAKP